MKIWIAMQCMVLVLAGCSGYPVQGTGLDIGIQMPGPPQPISLEASYTNSETGDYLILSSGHAEWTQFDQVHFGSLESNDDGLLTVVEALGNRREYKLTLSDNWAIAMVPIDGRPGTLYFDTFEPIGRS